LPPLDEFLPYLQKIWDSRILTNAGPFHQELESALCQYLGVPYISLFSNATIALVTAFQALQLQGEVITTPYSFVATSHALLWNRISPVFVDIDATSMNLNPDLIEAAITEKTTAILPVHCYGRPCDTEKIQRIAEKYQLKVVYDAAHTFAVRNDSRSILCDGDLSVISFHATKVFNTLEGGAIISPDKQTKLHIDHLKNFGFVDEVTVVEAGINGKMNELQAALGLVQLKHIDVAIRRRQQIDQYYRLALDAIKGIRCVEFDPEWHSNFSYFPILVTSEFAVSRDELYLRLKAQDIHPRRYFYPLIAEFEMYRNLPSANIENLPVAKRMSSQILCLPIYADLSDIELSRVIDVIRETME